MSTPDFSPLVARHRAYFRTGVDAFHGVARGPVDRS